MNDFDLDSELKALTVPERDADYWEMLPRRVLARTRVTPRQRVPPLWRPRRAWAGGIAFACLLIGLCLSPARNGPLKAVSQATDRAKSFHKELVQLPERARALMRIDHGLRSLIEEEPR
jgi:hypothetical protein